MPFKLVWIESVQLDLISSEWTLAVSREDTEPIDWLREEESLSQTICRTARSAGSSDIVVKLHSAFPKSGSSNCTEKSP